MYEQIEQLKRQYTDKHVVVVGDRPELARFGGITGRVKTVNMNGRVLVEFNAWSNTGWYDIAPEFLRIVPEPPPPTPVAKGAKVARPIDEATVSPPAAKPIVGEVAAPSEPKADSEEPSVTHEAGPEAPVDKRPRAEN